jgi:CO/xanthine dehydrogenase Mo-binding subunit
MPYSSIQAGSMTTHAHTRANYAAGLDAKRKLQEIAARDLGGSAGEYEVGGGRVYHRGNRSRSMTFAAAARRAVALGGEFDGHELPEDINDFTVRSATALAGQGLMGVAKDNFPREGSTFTWVIGFARVEIDVETGQAEIVEYVATADCGTMLHPRSLGAQIYGGSIQGFGVAVSQKWVYDPQWGVPFTKGFHMAKPPTMLDVPLNVQWAAVNEPDPYNPVGCKGIGEPPVGAGAGAVACAIQDALGAAAFNRTPITTEMIMAELEDIPAPFRQPTAHL